MRVLARARADALSLAFFSCCLFPQPRCLSSAREIHSTAALSSLHIDRVRITNG
jgi:hypothetical protein